MVSLGKKFILDLARLSSLCYEPKEQVDKWDSLIRVEQGQKFIRVVRENGVFAFIVKQDDGRFKKGDILKPAGYRAPAKNSARGNVLSGDYYIQWTGPLYMDSQRRLRG